VTSSQDRWSDSGLSTSRIEALSDGVFSIVLTLMVFEIKIPDLPAGHSHEAWAHVVQLWPQLLSYAVSFIAVGLFWVGHHQMYHMIRRSSRPLLWLNLLFLLFVAFLPFSVALLGRYGDAREIAILYGLNLLIIGTLNYAQWFYVTRITHHVIDAVTDNVMHEVDRRILFGPCVCVFAILVALVNARLSELIYLLMLIAYLLPARIDHVFSQK
jgi:uncharacterized membrane protein